MMDTAVRASLEAAYRGTDYCVKLAAGELRLKVDRQIEDDERRLREEAGVKSHWAIVTPCNPGSQALSVQTNQERLEQLDAILEEQGVRRIASVNRDPQKEWPDEPGFLLCDPPPGLAEQLGRRFRQNAMLIGKLGEAPQLLWLE
jgi:hypothetical protein